MVKDRDAIGFIKIHKELLKENVYALIVMKRKHESSNSLSSQDKPHSHCLQLPR